MDDTQAKVRRSPAPGRRPRHRLLKAFASLVLLGGGLVAALPWLLGTPPARAMLMARVNARLAPGSARLDGLGLSWTGPVVLDGLTLVDPKGKAVLAARRVTLARGLLGLIASRPDYGTITVEDAAVDVERRADGSVDLLDALASLSTPEAPTPGVQAPALGPAPAPSPLAVVVVVKGGTLKLASPELVGPLTASTLDGSLTIVPGRPMEVSATLGEGGRSLAIRATLDGGGVGDLAASVVGKGWPVHVRQGGVEARGAFDGNLSAKRSGGLWAVQGDAVLAGFEADGPSLRGDRLAFDRVAAACDLSGTSTGWVARKLELTSPVATLSGSGSIPALGGSPSTLRGKVDLAALARSLPNAMRLRDGLTLERGSVSIRADVTSAEGLDRLDLAASLDDFAATEAGRAVGLRKPVFVTARGRRKDQKVTVEALEVKASGIDVTAGGDLDSGVKLSGTVDLAAVVDQIRDVIDLGTLDLAGRARVAADYHHAGGSFKGRVAAEIQGLKVVGPAAEPFVREKVRLDASANGPSRPDGLPGDWREARLDLKAGETKLDVRATSADAGLGLVAGFETLVESPVAGRFDAKATLRKVGEVIEVDDLRAGITPTDPAASRGVVALAVRGRFDPKQGSGAFGPIPGLAPGAVGLGPDGATVAGVGRSGEPLRVDASLVGDLAALDALLAAWSASPPKGLAGPWAAHLGLARSAAGKVAVDATASSPALTYGSPRGAVALAIQGGYAPELDRLDLPKIELATAYGRAKLVLGLAETKGRRLMDLSGTLEPGWAAIDALVAQSVEPNARVRATIRPIHLAGSLQADTTPQLLGQLFGEVGLDLTTAEAFGVKLGATAVVLKMGGGKATFDPIRTTINDGPVSIVADLALDDANGVWLRLGNSRVDGAAINEAVSASILAYVAPVLAKASSVTGKVTTAIDAAWLPITATGPMRLDGAVAFQEVVFKPGPLAGELASLTGRASADLTLNEAMFVKVRDGRVEQHGLTIPIGGDGLKVAIDGSVGFDESLDLRATVPLTGKALGLGAAGDQLAAGTTVALPIRGTLGRPAIDRRALAGALRDAARNLGQKELKGEAGKLLERIAGPSRGSSEPRTRPDQGGNNPIGDLEDLGRQFLRRKKP